MWRIGRSLRLVFWISSCVMWHAPSSPAVTLVLQPTEDTYVRGGTDADTNFNGATRLRVKNASGESNDRHTLLRFDLTGASGAVLSASLNLYCKALTNGTPSAAFAYSVDDDAWQEETVTWNTSPLPTSLLDARTDIAVVGATYSFDITAFVAQELSGDGLVSLLLRDDSEIKRMVDFDRREDANPPTLVVETQTQFLLSVTSSGAGSVTLSPGGGAYDAGTVVTLTAVPDPGWQFVSWDGDLSGSLNPQSIVMDTTRSVLALFQPQPLLTLSVHGLGNVALQPPGGSYVTGTLVTLTAFPDAGWTFAGWSGDASGPTNPVVVVVDADKSVSATFTSGPPSAGDIVFLGDDAGVASNSATVSTSNDVVSANGDLCLAAIATQPFLSVTDVSGLDLEWTLVGEQCAGRGGTGISLWMAVGASDGAGSVSAQLGGVAQNATIAVARYAGADASQPLGVPVAGNSIGVAAACSAGTDTASYLLGMETFEPDAVVFGAVAHGDPTHSPGSGWVEREELHHGVAAAQASVSVAEQTRPNPGPLTFDGSLSAAADWAAVAVAIRPGPQKALELTTSGLGSVSLDPAGGSYSVQTLVSLSATPEPGWWFVAWQGGACGDSNPTSVLVYDDVEVSATFSSVPHYDLSIGVGGVGHVVATPPQRRHPLGTPVVLQVEIPPGWIFTGWGGDASGTSPSTTVVMTGDRNVTADFQFVGNLTAGLWTSASELAAAPMQGEAWNQVLTAADQPFFPPDVADQNSPHNVRCLAAAIVYARTGDTMYLDRVSQALDYLSTLGAPGSTTLAWGREVGTYALAADLVGYTNAGFETWLRDMAEVYVGSNGRTVLETFQERPNNWGTHAFGMLASVYAYLGDDAAVNTLRVTWVQGVTATPSLGEFGDLSWHQDPSQPRQINPALACRDGLDIDGALPDDVRRGGPFTLPPNRSGYPWEALQGIVMAARVLERYDPALSIWYVGDKAIFRAARLLQERWEQQFGGWAASGDDMWMLPFLDHVYGTEWASGADDEYAAGKNVGWAYVLSGDGDSPPTSSHDQQPWMYRVFPSAPNPFSQRTRIRFSLPVGHRVRAGVYDVLGRRVATLLHEFCPAGQHTVYWDGTIASGRRAPSGIYWCHIQAGAWNERVRVVLLR